MKQHTIYISIIALLFIALILSWATPISLAFEKETILLQDAQVEIQYIPYEVISLPIIQTIEVEKIVYAPIGELKRFGNDKELIDWLDTLILPDYGKNKCVEYALWLQREALKDGYQMSTQLVYRGDEPYHMINSTIYTNGKIKLIEPQTGESWTAGWQKQ